MSTTWDVWCVDCREGQGLYCTDHLVISGLIERRDAVVALSKIDVEITTWRGAVDPEWFEAHAGHKLVPRNGYGDLLDLKCQRCGDAEYVLEVHRDVYLCSDCNKALKAAKEALLADFVRGPK